ncbi:tape measure protein [Kineococcus sp. SYSU DK005]|uniref:tape measure protein n=1 Tax=Kineococcus sp. SYSU DK005 TaxID=3383126 RepID=UPI003D7C9826
MAEVAIRINVAGGDQAARQFRGTAVEVAGLGAATERASSRMHAALWRIGTIGISAARGVGYVTAALGGLGAAAATVGLKTAANMEQANIAFTTMLGSGERAQGFLTDLNKFAATTPFDFPGLTTAASSLISAGIDANKVIPIMRSLGNATSGMGTGAEGIARATVALQQMNAAGKIQAEDLNQLRDAGIPVYDLLTAATGKSTAQIAEMVDKGKLGRAELDALMSALESGKGLEKFNGLMEAQSQSLSGMVSTLKDTAGMGLSGAFSPAIPFLKTILTDANALLTRVLPGITTGVGKVTAAIAGVYEIAVRGDFNGGWWGQLGVEEDSRIIDYLFRIREAISGAGSAVAGVDWTGVGTRVLDTMRSVAQAFSNIDWSALGVGLTAVGKSMGDFGTIAVVAGGFARILGGTLQFLAEHVDTIVKFAPVIAAGLLLWRAGMAVATVAAGAQAVATLATAAATTANALATLHASNTLRLMNGVTQQAIVLRIRDAVVSNAQAVATLASAAASRVAAAGQWLWNAALTANPIGLVVVAIAALAAGLTWFFTKTEVGRKAWDKLSGAFREGVAWIQNAAVPLFRLGLSAALDAARSKFDTIKNAVGGFVAKVREAWDWVKRLADRISDSALGQAVSSIGGAFGIGGARAAGGPVDAGTTYLVGEQGPELFTAPRAGRILSHEQTLTALSPSTMDAPRVSLVKDDLGLSGQDLAGLAQPVVVSVQIDGRELLRAVATEANRKMARS